jgi:hypothetical protein
MTRTLRPMTRRIRNLTVLGLAALLGLVSFITTAGADPKIKCGSPTKSGGFVTITITLQKGGEEPHVIVMRDISFGRGYPAADKAAFVAALITMVEDPNGEFITATHADGSDEVELHGQHGWTIAGHAIGPDGTGEPDWVAYDGASTGAEALCSLSGTATGTSPLGGQGVVGIQAFGWQAHLSTSPGMPAQFVESMLMQQLQSQGVPVRWAQPGDFQGTFRAMGHDEMVLFITSPDPNAPTSLFNIVADDGLQLDLMALAGPPDSPSGVVPVSGSPVLRLDVAPSVFSTGPVSVQYDSGSRAGLVRITAHDVMGRSLGTLFEGSAGHTGTFVWDGRDRDHQPLAGGAYFLRMETPNGTTVRRVTRAR